MIIMNKELEFIESLYEMSDEELKKFYKILKSNRDDVLQKIANIMLDYNINNDSMKINSIEKNKLIGKMTSEIKFIFNNVSKEEVEFIDDLLTIVAKESFKFWNYNIDFKDVRKIISENFKGKHFSDRVWNNEQQVAEVLHKSINDFLDGKINVNQIKSTVKNVFNNSAYNTRRLVETEVARVQDNAFKKFCRETEVKNIKRVAILDLNTCQRCAADDGRIYELNKSPDLPVHPLCRCFFTIIDDKIYTMNLQLFSSVRDKNNIINMIKNGELNKEEFSNFKNGLDSAFINGVTTPIGKVYNANDRAYHIAYKHEDLMDMKSVERIKETLSKPDSIRKAVDINGAVNNAYLKKFNDKLLLVIANNDIITAYYPRKNYIKNKVEGWDVLWGKK